MSTPPLEYDESVDAPYLAFSDGESTRQDRLDDARAYICQRRARGVSPPALSEPRARTSPQVVGEVRSTRGAVGLHRQVAQATLESNAPEARLRDGRVGQR